MSQIKSTESLAGITPVPRLAEKHSGVPDRLADIAKISKAWLYSHKTHSTVYERKANEELPILPPDISRAAFNEAIKDLKSTVGENNVELNVKPLEDGWYLEHP